jgi:hypothetical protein
MIPRVWRVTSLIIISTWSAGCAVQNVVDPGTVTLERALVDTVDALAAAHAESVKRGTNFGFYGCSVTAVYNISASATQNNKITLGAAGPPVPIVPISYTGQVSSEAQAQGNRGNQVTVVLNTPYCMPNAKVLPPGRGGKVIQMQPSKPKTE